MRLQPGGSVDVIRRPCPRKSAARKASRINEGWTSPVAIGEKLYLFNFPRGSLSSVFQGILRRSRSCERHTSGVVDYYEVGVSELLQNESCRTLPSRSNQSGFGTLYLDDNDKGHWSTRRGPIVRVNERMPRSLLQWNRKKRRECCDRDVKQEILVLGRMSFSLPLEDSHSEEIASRADT